MTIHWKALGEHFLIACSDRFKNFREENAFSEFFLKASVLKELGNAFDVVIANLPQNIFLWAENILPPTALLPVHSISLGESI
jgi:hypothetical protein